MYIVMRSQVVKKGLYIKLNNISDGICSSDNASNLTLFNNALKSVMSNSIRGKLTIIDNYFNYEYSS